MPIYEYHCTTCGHRFETLQKTGAAAKPDCPACGSAEVEKEMSTFASTHGSSSGSCSPSTGGG